MKSAMTIVLLVVTDASIGFAADQIAPRTADSSAAQRDRQLTLIGHINSSPEELARRKATILKQIKEAKQSALSAIDAQINRASHSEEEVRVLRQRRDAASKRWTELEDKVQQLKPTSPSR